MPNENELLVTARVIAPFYGQARRGDVVEVSQKEIARQVNGGLMSLAVEEELLTTHGAELARSLAALASSPIVRDVLAAAAALQALPVAVTQRAVKGHDLGAAADALAELGGHINEVLALSAALTTRRRAVESGR